MSKKKKKAAAAASVAFDHSPKDHAPKAVVAAKTVNKSEYIRERPHMKAQAVVDLAKSQGITLTTAHVYVVRAKANAKANKSAGAALKVAAPKAAAPKVAAPKHAAPKALAPKHVAAKPVVTKPVVTKPVTKHVAPKVKVTVAHVAAPVVAHENGKSAAPIKSSLSASEKDLLKLAGKIGLDRAYSLLGVAGEVMIAMR